MQNFGETNKEHYGMLWYFLEWPIFYGTLQPYFTLAIDVKKSSPYPRRKIKHVRELNIPMIINSHYYKITKIYSRRALIGREECLHESM